MPTMKAKILIKSPSKIKNPEGKSRRSVGKTCLLAACYGMSGATAASRLGKSKEEGQKILDNFFTGFPQVKKAIDNSKAFLKDKGYVEDWAGRRRHLDDIYLDAYEVKAMEDPKAEKENFNPIIGCPNRSSVSDQKLAYWKKQVKDAVQKSQNYQKSKNKNYVVNDEMSNMSYEKLAKEALADKVIITANTGRRAQAERQCFNARIQGGAASLTKLAMVNITRDKEMLDCKANLIITVHDEVLVECPAYYADRVEKRLPQIMVDTAKPYINVPMKCDPACESRWYASEAAAEIQSNFAKLESKLGSEAATKQIIFEHPELPEQSILDVIAGAEELVF